MSGTTARQCSYWALLAIVLLQTAACSSKPSAGRYATPGTGSSCYAKSLPTAGEGGLAWGDTLNMARKKSLDNCIRYAGRSGGTPNTCKVVLAECRNK